MHEHIVAAVIGRDEPVPLLVAEPVHTASRHRNPLERNEPIARFGGRAYQRDSESGGQRLPRPAARRAGRAAGSVAPSSAGGATNQGRSESSDSVHNEVSPQSE